MSYRSGTHNGPANCAHGKTMKTDNCRRCWEDRGWRDLRFDVLTNKFVVAVLPDGTVVP